MQFLISDADILRYILVFMRVFGLVFFMPGSGAGFVPANVKVAFSIALCMLIVPIIDVEFFDAVTSLPLFVLYMCREFIVGFFISVVLNILTSALITAGTIIGMQVGLSMASTLNPESGEQNMVFSNFLNLIFVTALFVADFHHILIDIIMNSYKFTSVFDSGVFLQTISKTFSYSFLMGVKLASPVVIIGTVMYFGFGILNKLIPNMQIFFVLTPAQIWIGFYITFIIIAGMSLWYINNYINIVDNVMYNNFPSS